MEKTSNESFTELEVWRKARILKNDIWKLTKSFPVDERYRLTSQLTRSSRAINSNIAEGHGRYTHKDQAHFCIQARGSLSETYNHMIDAFDCGYISELELNNFKKQIEEVSRLLNGYISYLRKKIEKDVKKSTNQLPDKSTDQPIN